MIIPNPGSIVKTDVMGQERIILVEKVVITIDNLYLIKYTDTSDKRSYINCHYVTEIISTPSAITKPLNFFDKDTNESRYLSYSRKCYVGSLDQIITHCMRKLPYAINRPLDSDKCHELWEKTKPGLVGRFDFFGNGNGYPIIKKKKIQKWVAVNWSKLLIDKNVWQKSIDVRNKEIADEYWEYVEEEMDRDFENFYN